MSDDMTAEEQLHAIRDLVARYAHVSGTRVLPLPKVVAKLVEDWATLVERQIEEDEQNAEADRADEDFEVFFKTHTPEEVDARLREDGIDPADVRRWAADFKRFIPVVFRAKERAEVAEAQRDALREAAEVADAESDRHEPALRLLRRVLADLPAAAAERDEQLRREGAAKEHAELQPLLWHPLRDRNCKSCGGSGWIIFNDHCDCVDAAFKKLRDDARAEYEPLVREAKNVLLGITAARAAGFPLAKLEDEVMKLIEEEKAAEEKT